MAGKRGVNWPLEDRPWMPNKARERVLAQLRSWGYTVDEASVGNVVALLAAQVVQDTDSRVSLHMSPRNDQALIVLLSHQSGRPPADEAAMRTLAATRPVVVSCGTDTSNEVDDGPSVWAVIDLTPPKRLAGLKLSKKLSTA
ncbi:hypothetical protein [Streptomyces chattanoogensis]|uniref:hypothetical protein n=1 Tax=Streptomyces chattanoogensis TaxID=66876 RepID=UPI0036780636